MQNENILRTNDMSCYCEICLAGGYFDSWTAQLISETSGEVSHQNEEIGYIERVHAIPTLVSLIFFQKMLQLYMVGPGKWNVL